MKNSQHSWGYIILLIVLAILALIVLDSLGPHTSPGVKKLDGRQALVHDGEQLALWVPVGKRQVKYSFKYEDSKVTASDGFLYHQQKTIGDSCVNFNISLFYTVEACPSAEGVTIKWPWGIRWAD